VAGRCEAGNGVSGLGKWCYRDAETWDARIGSLVLLSFRRSMVQPCGNLASPGALYYLAYNHVSQTRIKSSS